MTYSHTHTFFRVPPTDMWQIEFHLMGIGGVVIIHSIVIRIDMISALCINEDIIGPSS